MTGDEIIDVFLSDICRAFPEISPLMARHDGFMTAAKMEAFANATTQAFSVGDVTRGAAYLDFMSKRLETAVSRELEYIDVYYVENLFWPKATPAARLGWPLVPENLKALYLRFHGKPPL